MQADKTTLTDLSIFNSEEDLSVFHYLNFTKTVGGKEWLRLLLSRPLNDIKEIRQTQNLLKKIIAVHAQWPETISNGTVMVVEKFFDTALQEMPQHPNKVNSFIYKLLNGPDYSLTRYSVEHFITFIKGIHQIAELLEDAVTNIALHVIIERIKMLLHKEAAQKALEVKDFKALDKTEILRLGYLMRRHFKNEIFELIDIYSRLDAYYSLATASLHYNLCFPEFSEAENPELSCEGLYHLLLKNPVPYTITLDKAKNFLFLTGANMAGKSTFIKAVGVAVYLAHIGMSVPAQSMQLSFFDGLLSNIQVVDNIIKGESYFFNEVQRIRKTIEKISDGKKWLILIDELFKGTNVQDAMKCSITVIEGLRKMNNALFVLSTHLYEISETLQQYDNIQFRYFETRVEEDQLLFNYQLQNGISNDRLGYLILKREGVVALLQKLNEAKA